MERRKVVVPLLLWFHLLGNLVISFPIKQLISEGDTSQKCAFKKFDQRTPDAFPSKSTVTCDETFLSLKKIYDHSESFGVELHGAQNAVDLMLARIGNFKPPSFWTDQRAANELLSKSICQNHWMELFSQWPRVDYKHVKWVKGKLTCRWPKELGGHYSGSKAVAPPQLVGKLSKKGAFAVAKETGKVLQVGIALCKPHVKSVNDMIRRTFPKDSGSKSDEELEREMESAIAADELEEKKATVKEFTQQMGYCKLATQNDYESLSSISKERKLRAAKQLFYEIAGIISPNNEKKFVDDVCSIYSTSSNDKNTLDKICLEVANLYEKADGDKRQRLFAIASVVNIVSYPVLRRYIPNLTEYMFRKALKLVRDNDIPKQFERRRYERYQKEEINKFIDFLTSPTCLISLPYGIKHAKLSDKTKIDIPHTIRIQRHAEIIRMYVSKRREEEKNPEFQPLPRSTMFEICHHCYAIRSKALTCVDNYLASGYEAFDFLEKTLTEWHENDVMTVQEADILKRRLKDGRLYLRTDFNIAMVEHSPVLSHCLLYALSDAKDKSFQRRCATGNNIPGHIILCERCEKLQKTLQAVLEFAVERSRLCKEDELCGIDESDDREIEENLIRDAVFDINEMKKHQVRSRYSEIQRKGIVAELDDTAALITLDFAQKLLPSKFYEKQSDYFGKKGMSYHITNVLTKKSGAFVTHDFVHILDETLQDSDAVIAIITDVLTNISICGINKVILRSDNAGCYHSRSLLLSLAKISEATGVRIVRYAFSEPQAGKSSCDRKAAVVKNRVRDYINTNHIVRSTTQFFDSLLDPRPLTFTTVSLSRVKTEFPSASDKKTIPGISSFFDFVPEDGGIRAFKFYGIGNGKLFKYDVYHPPAHLAFLEHLQTNNSLHLNDECSHKYWRSSKTTLQQSSPLIGGQKDVFYCPVETCDATFDTNGELEAHMLADVHNDRPPEQQTQMDYVLVRFVKSIEGLVDSLNDPIEAELHQSAIENSHLTNLGGLKEGWAHRSTRPNPKFTEESRKFLIKIFDDGAARKLKLTGEQALNAMRAAKTTSGERQFRAGELLRAEQITSFFSRINAERKKATSDEPPKKKKKVSKRSSDTCEDETDEPPNITETSEDEIYEAQNNDELLLESAQLMELRRNELREIQFIEVEEMIDNVVKEMLDTDE
uniref:C2H2-type domain-containing protein n=1 Tax=Panagrellus redivivus TaxID=6233 RepID=A0A7E4V3E4_PANRE